MNAMLTCAQQFDVGQVLERLHAYKVRDTIQKVTRSAPEEFPAIGEERYHVAMMDYGVKQNMIDCLRRRGCSVTALPASTPAETVLSGGYDGVLLSNGPGDPAENTDMIREIKKLYDSGLPLYGICLGHQMLALATGARTGKMDYGHRGGNHPVRDVERGRCLSPVKTTAIWYWPIPWTRWWPRCPTSMPTTEPARDCATAAPTAFPHSSIQRPTPAPGIWSICLTDL